MEILLLIDAFFDHFDKLILVTVIIFEIKLFHTIIHKLLDNNDYISAIAGILCVLGIFILLISGYTKGDSDKFAYTAAFASFMNMGYLLLCVGLYKKYFQPDTGDQK